jgi:hypothetical protein
MERRVRAAWGVALLLAPGVVLCACGGERTRRVKFAARLLGARHVGEALVPRSAREPGPPRWMIAADTLHGASMLVLAAGSPRLRRAALLSAASAGALVALSVAER